MQMLLSISVYLPALNNIESLKCQHTKDGDILPIFLKCHIFQLCNTVGKSLSDIITYMYPDADTARARNGQF